ncbi:MAG: stage III sporulation protein AC [Clostridia bacterium]|nr:stage III sporulation protein AC [Clostridia bacterium]
MDITMLLKIAGLGILTSLIATVLKQSGREELSTVAVIIGLVIGTVMMLSMITSLLDTVRTVFSLY